MLMKLPNDPVMLLSAVNMKLRDQYDSLDALCDDFHISPESIEKKPSPESAMNINRGSGTASFDEGRTWKKKDS